MPANPRRPHQIRWRDRLPRRAGAPARRWRSSLRLRYAITATLFAGATFAVGGAVALTLYHDSLVSNIDDGVRGTANAIAKAAKGSPLPDPIPMPVASGVPRVQVLNSSNKVISGDPASVGSPPMLTLARDQNQRIVSVAHPANLPERHAAVVAIHTTSPAGPLTIVVAASLDPVDDKTNQALQFSALFGAMSLAVVAVVAWLTAGRTLRRVERLRAQVAMITASGDLARRVPDAGTDELAHLSSTLNGMLAAMSRSSERQRRFVADAAHELRTPLAGLSASLEVAISHPETAADGTWIAELSEGHRRLGRLVNDLLVLASLDGDAPPRRHLVDLAGVVIDATRRPTPAGIELRAEPIEHAVVSGDESQLARVVTNLVENALHHAGTTVQVTLTSEDGHADITVADDGPGVPPSERERIWGRFVRLDDDRARASGGSGLGLALVKELVHAHGGTVSVTGPTQGAGARFVVRLPLRAAGDQPTDSDGLTPPARHDPVPADAMSHAGWRHDAGPRLHGFNDSSSSVRHP
jgi:signal transduction histidine kinase